MSLTYDVLVVGSYSLDLIFSGMTEFPQLGKDTISKDFRMTPGEAFIAAVSMHRLGLKVGWAADFGNDDFSQFALSSARQEGLDESLFVIHNHPYRRISASASYPHDRAFLTYYDPDPPLLAYMPALMKATARVVYIPGLYYGSFVDVGSKLIRAKGMKLAMDGNSSHEVMRGKTKVCAAIRKAIKNTDVFLPNAQEAMRLTAEVSLEPAMQALAEYSPLVVVKDGCNGSYAYMKGRFIHVSAIKVNAIDTTGAGDSYNAGFLYAWLEGQPIEVCLQWGNITGGLSTTELGGTTRRITLEEVKKTLTRCYP